MSTDIISTIGGGAGKISRYFSVVSALPAAVFAAYAYLLVQATDWFGPVDWSRIARFELADVAVLGISALVMAMALNPLQYPLIRLLEGYWGTSALAVELAVIRTDYHRRRSRSLFSEGTSAAAKLGNPIRALDTSTADQETLRAAVVFAENRRARSDYPDRHRLLPTRLGNVLRRYEDAISRTYGLDPLTAVPRLAMVAGEKEVAYVENQRIQLELAVRTTLLALLASPLTVLFLSRSQTWMLLAVVPYSVAFLAYRGAVSVAHEYGTSLAVLTDLGRFPLYERLHLPHPRTITDERATNEELARLFRLKRGVSLEYEVPGSHLEINVSEGRGASEQQ
ncbi:hypothetical protein [Cryptosporangium aurantiacum]|uniref:Uncharacterized protein n=1 Tax=Cryptosporangium aurantiacum TaxID=134849 RepID=A0A1M7KT39_9ACTN|nr:hypothetical protein [Cryptosporangium aurantiacum]SHM68643.1 hypothetical protein SAMN05443668_1011250 [Cryptosporangium aurantiacum]